MKRPLPLAISVPHGGSVIPPEVDGRILLTPEQIAADGDEGAPEVYDIEDEVSAYVSASVARAVLDMNRAPEDIGRDGVIKEYTVFGEKVWDTFPKQAVIDELMHRYYFPYHERLSTFKESGTVLGLDCHTMLATGPETALDEGARRPLVCIGTGDGTCPAEWIDLLVVVLTEQFGDSVTINRPFSGGHIIRSHALEMPWVQLEISRDPSLNAHQKRIRLLIALSNWCRRAGVL